MIVKHPSKVLERVCAETKPAAVERLAQVMLGALLESKDAVGLAAPQLNQSVRVVVIDPYPTFDDNAKRILSESTKILINPRVIVAGVEKDTAIEGCLSFPGLQVPVSRSRDVTIEYMLGDGTVCNEMMSGWSARVVQHEIDHLDGVTIFNKANRQLRRSYMKRIRSAR